MYTFKTKGTILLIIAQTVNERVRHTTVFIADRTELMLLNNFALEKYDLPIGCCRLVKDAVLTDGGSTESLHSWKHIS